MVKILVTGGGIGGVTAALCLANDGHDVEVFEQADAFSEAGAGIQVSPNCSRVLHALGLEAALSAAGFLPEGTEARQWDSGRTIMTSPLGNAAVEAYGFPYYHIHRGDLLEILVNAARASDRIRLHTRARVTEFTDAPGKVVVKVDGVSHEGDLLVGADGIHSAIRTSLWGEEKPQFTGNIAWRALVPAASLPAGRVRPVTTVWWGPRRHFVHYYVKGGELVNCVCVVEKDGWETESWTERGDYEELKSDFSGWHEDVQMLIDHADRDSLYKWALFDRRPMSAWGRGRVTLLGDACHPTLPFMAQGAAMAIEDSAVLAACLKRASDIPLALQRYEDLRRERTAGVQNGSRRNATVFHLSGIKAWVRNLAARRASGSTMDNLYRYNALEAATRSP